MFAGITIGIIHHDDHSGSTDIPIPIIEQLITLSALFIYLLYAIRVCKLDMNHIREIGVLSAFAKYGIPGLALYVFYMLFSYMVRDTTPLLTGLGMILIAVVVVLIVLMSKNK